ncbi:hypothetical protein ElyMa_000472700 [Elysia marginata]|uniref:Uncharacterized protein n=1 Tax=Elysia marginata TaxID=1093978 RepID=A0AAV4FTJ5_9GAST|nr:hypothetical protein ElyMa_000472700 [Elysia marginata]
MASTDQDVSMKIDEECADTDFMEINSSSPCKAGLLSGHNGFSNGAVVHYIDLDKKYRDEVRWQLYKSADSDIKHLVETAPPLPYKNNNKKNKQTNKQNKKKMQLYGSLPTISQTIRERKALMRTTVGNAKMRLPAMYFCRPQSTATTVLPRCPVKKTNSIYKLCEDANCLSDTPEMMAYRTMWRERLVRTVKPTRPNQLR